MGVAGFNGRVTLDRLAYAAGDGKYYKMAAVGLFPAALSLYLSLPGTVTTAGFIVPSRYCRGKH